MTMRHAACVVNLTRQQLDPFLETMEPETDPEFASAQGQILSYEEAPMWLERTWH
jgi:hypothetical protein